MAKYVGNQSLNQIVGVSSHSEDLTSLQVIGRLGINTADAMQPLHVEGDAYISGSIGIGTSVPGDPVQINNTTKISVGIVTANEIYGELKGNTGIVTAASNIAGLSTGQLLVQTAQDTTSFFDYGSTGQVLASRGLNQQPNWVNAAPSGAITGLLLFDEGAAVGLGTTFGGIDFRGSSISVEGGDGGGIATVFTTGNLDNVNVAGLSTFLGSVGIGTTNPLGPVDSNNNTVLNAGIVTAKNFFGDGSGLFNVAAGKWAQTDVGIHTLTNVGIATTNPLTDFQVGAATSSFTVVSTASTIMVGIGTTDPSYTLDVMGDTNIEGSLTINENTVPSLAMVIALGGF